MDAYIRKFHWKGEVHGGQASLSRIGKRLQRVGETALSRALDASLSARIGDDQTVYILRRVENQFFHNDAIAMTDDKLAQRWAEVLANDIAGAMDKAEPENVARFKDQADYVARYVEDVLDGVADDVWWYGPLIRQITSHFPEPHFSGPGIAAPGQGRAPVSARDEAKALAVTGVLRANSDDLDEILGRLHRRGRLPAVLAHVGSTRARGLWADLAARDALPFAFGLGDVTAAEDALHGISKTDSQEVFQAEAEDSPAPALRVVDGGRSASTSDRPDGSPDGSSDEGAAHLRVVASDGPRDALRAADEAASNNDDEQTLRFADAVDDGLEALADVALRLVERLGLRCPASDMRRGVRGAMRENPVIANPASLAAAFRAECETLIDWREPASLSKTVLSILWFLYRKGLIAASKKGAAAEYGGAEFSGDEPTSVEPRAAHIGVADGFDWLDGDTLRQGLDILWVQMSAGSPRPFAGSREARAASPARAPDDILHAAAFHDAPLHDDDENAAGAPDDPSTASPSTTPAVPISPSTGLPVRPTFGQATPHQTWWLECMTGLIQRGRVDVLPGAGNEAFNALALLGAVVALSVDDVVEGGGQPPGDAATDRVLKKIIAAAVTAHGVMEAARDGVGLDAGTDADVGAPPDAGAVEQRAVQLMATLGESAKNLLDAMAQSAARLPAAAYRGEQAPLANKGRWIETPAAGVFLLLRGIMDCRFPALSVRLDYPGGLATRPDDLLYALAQRWAGDAGSFVDPALALVAGVDAQKDRAALARGWSRVDDASHDAFQRALFDVARNQKLVADGDPLHVWRVRDADGHAFIIGGNARVWPFSTRFDDNKRAADVIGAWVQIWSGGEKQSCVVIDEGTLPDNWASPDIAKVLHAPRKVARGSDGDDSGAFSDHADARESLTKTLDGLDRGRLGVPCADMTLALAAALTVAVWGRWLRGIGNSSAPYLLDNLIRRPGRVRFDPDRGLDVDIEPGALGVVLGLSGYLDPIESVSWLGDMGVSFTQEGGR